MERLSLSKLAEVIKCRRAEKNITQEQLSKLSSLNRNTIGRIERMDYIPSIPQLEKLADVLDFDLSILFFDDNEKRVYTAFKKSSLTDEGRSEFNYVMEMMLVARQQIMIRRALAK